LTPRGKTDPLYTIKAAALAALQEIKAGLSGSGTVTSAQIEQAIRAVISQTLRTEEEKQLAPAVASLRAMSKLATQIDAAKDWVVGNLPHFPSASPTVPTTGDGSLQSLAPHLSKAELQKLDPAFITHLLVDVCGNVEVVREREYDAGAPRVWRNALDTQCAKIQKLLDRPPERIAFADSALQRGELLRVVREQFAVFRKSMDALGGKARSAHRPSEAHINQFLRCLADHFGERLGRTHYREISELLFHLQLTKRQLRPREISVRAAKHRRQFPNAYRTERAAFKLDA
jgi:hypothetical protein